MSDCTMYLVTVHKASLLEKSQMPSEKSASSFLSFYLKHPACEFAVSIKAFHEVTQSHELTMAGNWPHINLFSRWLVVSGSINCRFHSY